MIDGCAVQDGTNGAHGRESAGKIAAVVRHLRNSLDARWRGGEGRCNSAIETVQLDAVC